MASLIAVSEATTGSTLNPVMNLMSSMAKTFVGSVIAIVKRRSHTRERHNLVADRRFLRDQLDHRRIHFVKFQIDGRNAVLPGENRGDVVVADQPQLHQARAQAAAVFLLVARAPASTDPRRSGCL